MKVNEPMPPLVRFCLVLVGIELLRFGLGFVSLPMAALPIVNPVVSALFLGLPVFAIYQASEFEWKPKHAVIFIVVGIALQALMIFLGVKVFSNAMVPSAICRSFSQLGLQTWCIGLGALLGASVREKNILIPIAIFLVMFDIFLVLSPIGPTANLIKTTPILQHAGLSIPQASSAPATGRVKDAGFIGPADLVFLGAFLVAITRFKMRITETFRAVLITLVLYLFFVLGTGIALPALVPIGIVTLFVNRKEFKLSKDEWASTAVIFVLGLGLLAYAFTRPKPKLLPPKDPAPSAQQKTDSGVPPKSVPVPAKP